MSDVFLSYSRDDAAKAEEIATALRAHGFDVWWDQKIPAGLTWREYIPQKIDGARALVVLWSKASVTSEWVQEEAGLAKGMKKLIPANIDGAHPPFGFREIEGADLSSWHGERDHPEWLNLIEGLRRVLGQPSRPAARPSPADTALRNPSPVNRHTPVTPLEVSTRKSRVWPIALLVGVIVLGVAGYSSLQLMPRAPVADQAVTQTTPKAYDLSVIPPSVASVARQAQESANAAKMIAAEARALKEDAENFARAARAGEPGYEVRDLGRVTWEGERLQVGGAVVGVKTFRSGATQSGRFLFNGIVLAASPAVQRVPQGGEFAGADSPNALAWEGPGEFTFSDGGVHGGTWRWRGSELPGVLTTADGRRYEGQFRHVQQSGYDMQQHGLGVLWDSSGSLVQAGRWDNGVFAGPVE